MQDFIRIGGPVVSAPLNENFRRLLNAISIANTNLVFPEKNGTVNTITDMLAIEDPDDAQACYVISSGEFYRYSKREGKWIKIMDIGQTFRQGFLNSGAVVFEDYIKLKDGSKTVLNIPRMLVYFKNKPGDDRYLKGMYLIEAKELNISDKVSGANSYSIFVDCKGDFTLTSGIPKTTIPEKVRICTFLLDKENNIMPNFIYTLPEMAYTADRGRFLMTGGESNGCNLRPAEGVVVNRASGYYYDEGINFPMGPTDNFPVDTDNGANFDLKAYEAETPVKSLFYMTPDNPLENNIIESKGLIYDKYWDGSLVRDVPEGYFTIQQHLVTPNGQNIILYGTKLYNSITDAVSSLNTVYGLSLDFPYVETTRIVLGNVGSAFSTKEEGFCQFFTLGRLAQVGTISPEFADNLFRIYSGEVGDTTPATVKFSLDKLEEEEYNELYNLIVLPHGATRKHFYADKKYITDEIIVAAQQEQKDNRVFEGSEGYALADSRDLDDAVRRIEDLEREVWHPFDNAKQRYEQSVRYRLFTSEKRLDAAEITLGEHENRIDTLEKNRVRKETKINGYALGDTSDKDEAKQINLVTGDVAEGRGSGNNINLWYTDERVSANPDVKKGVAHAEMQSKQDNAVPHEKVNPHNLSTDDINILADTKKIFVTPEEERRIRADRLPDNTIKALEDLDLKNLDSIRLSYQEGNSERPGSNIVEVGDFKKLRFYKHGVNISMDSDGETAILECVGQTDETTAMFKNRYATLEAEHPDVYGGYVDKAVNADFAYNIGGIENAKASQYYGTSKDGAVGVYDLPVYVASADAGAFTSFDNFTFEPIDGTVQEKHLEKTLRDKVVNNYHTVFNGGVLKSAEVNTFDFGNNLKVTIKGNKATVDASVSGSAADNKFTSLSDVDITYTGNEGKLLVVNDKGTGLSLAKMPPARDYMLRSVYVSPKDTTAVKKAIDADKAALADIATNALKLNGKEADDTSVTTGLWTAQKIMNNTSLQIKEEGVQTYSGNVVPADSLGKDGDIYILTDN